VQKILFFAFRHGTAARRPCGVSCHIAHPERFADFIFEIRCVEVGVRNGGEQAVHHDVVGFQRPYSEVSGFNRPRGDAFQGMHEQVLQFRRLRFLAANAFGEIAALVSHGFLALIAEHSASL